MLNSRPTELEYFKKMVLIRETENLLVRHYPKNALKTPIHLANGAEAIPCGIIPFVENPRIFGTYRNHHWYIETTNDVRSLLLELMGKAESPSQGRAGSMHVSYAAKGVILNSAVVATAIPIALGDAWVGMQTAAKSQTICVFGDGATEEGVFWETLNFASLKKIPILFVCEDNDLAIHAFKKDRQAFELKKCVEGFRIPYFFGEGYDVRKVITLAQEALSNLNRGPVFIHLKYYRLLEHVGINSDFNHDYRRPPTDVFTAKDPIWNMKSYLKNNNVTESELKSIEIGIENYLESLFVECLNCPNVSAESIYNFSLRPTS